MKFYSPIEVAEITKQSRRTVYRHIESGLLKAVKIGSNWKISQEVLDLYTQGETQEKGE